MIHKSWSCCRAAFLKTVLFLLIISIKHCHSEELCVAGTMLIKARLGDVQKFVRIMELDLKEFLIAGKKLTLHSELYVRMLWQIVVKSS